MPGGHGLQHHGAMAVTLGEECIGEEAQEPDKEEGDAVGQARRLVMPVQIDGSVMTRHENPSLVADPF
jgi:hypothetical protein